jgi:hypothetical protein
MLPSWKQTGCGPERQLNEPASQGAPRMTPYEADATQLAALDRLCDLANSDTGQARRIANFLLSWHNAEENGGWDPTDFWNVDEDIAADMLIVLYLVRESHSYPDRFVGKRIETIWQLWRGSRQTS